MKVISIIIVVYLLFLLFINVVLQYSKVILLLLLYKTHENFMTHSVGLNNTLVENYCCTRFKV